MLVKKQTNEFDLRKQKSEREREREKQSESQLNVIGMNGDLDLSGGLLFVLGVEESHPGGGGFGGGEGGLALANEGLLVLGRAGPHLDLQSLLGGGEARGEVGKPGGRGAPHLGQQRLHARASDPELDKCLPLGRHQRARLQQLDVQLLAGGGQRRVACGLAERQRV